MKSIKDIFSFFKKKEEELKQPKERKKHSLKRMALAEVKVVRNYRIGYGTSSRN